MGIRMVNPWFRSGPELKAEAVGPVVIAWMKANPGNKVVTLAELKAALPDVAADLTRNVLNIICDANGILIENPGDPA